jgi:hypothetical protein
MKARSAVQDICRSKVIPNIMKLILYEKAILTKDHIHRLTGEKLKYFIKICESCNIPDSLLRNETNAEQFINEMLSNNFNLNEHFESLIPSHTQANTSQWSIFFIKYGPSPRQKEKDDNPIAPDWSMEEK